MAFQTGTASSFINLLDALRLFATANGWTQNQWSAVGADQWLSLQKGSIYANFLAEADNTDCWIMGALGYSGAAAWNAQPSTMPQGPRMSTALDGAITWPVTYWLFQHASPDSIEVVIRYQPTKFQWLMFGGITKYGTWTGGEFYAGAFFNPINTSANYPKAFFLQQDIGRTPVLFHEQNSAALGGASSGSNIHVEIDSKTWWSNDAEGSARVSCSRHVWPLVTRTLSAFNGLMTLQPIWLYALRPDGLYSPIGRVEHVRYANVLNHSPGDIISIGGEQWIVFPWLEKGGLTDSAGLHAGYAVKYDGP